MIEAWGRGIRRVVDICREAGNPTPTWRLEAGGDGRARAIRRWRGGPQPGQVSAEKPLRRAIVSSLAVHRETDPGLTAVQVPGRPRACGHCELSR